MKQRIDWKAVAPERFAAQRGLETYGEHCLRPIKKRSQPSWDRWLYSGHAG